MFPKADRFFSIGKSNDDEVISEGVGSDGERSGREGYVEFVPIAKIEDREICADSGEECD